MVRKYLSTLISWGRPGKTVGSDARLMQELDRKRLPKHIAIIMDGNGRWARTRGLPRAMGHRAGVESLREIVRTCTELEISVLTVYAFSTENWRRPQEEVDVLMDLLSEYLRKELDELHRHGIQIRPIGRIQELPPGARDELERAVRVTGKNNRLILNIALNYGGRAEILDATRELIKEATEGKLHPDAIDEERFSGALYTRGLPDPDLLIRPSGEMRLSNFLLWQLAYTEFWVTDVYWPDFRRGHFLQALVDYQSRDRRFGGLKI